ncbi:MAG: hypothetical protein ACREBR_05385 [bacterium]
MDDLDTCCTEFAICPWCGAEFIDSFEMSDGVWDCDRCGKKFTLDHDVTVSYTTNKVEEKSNV